MTRPDAFDPHHDAFLSYEAAIAALRLRAVVEGAVPREEEPVSLVMLCALAQGRGG